MQIITPNNGAVVAEGDGTLDALKIRQTPLESTGGYFISARTGLVATASAFGSFFYLRWTHPTLFFVLDLIRVRALFTTPPTAAQEWIIDACVYRDTTTGPSTGTFLGATQIPKKRSSYGYSALQGAGTTTAGGIWVAGVATIAGPGSPDVSEFMSDTAWELAAGTAVPRSKMFLEKDYTQGQDSPLMLRVNEAIAIRNCATVGAAGVQRVSAEVAWHEVDPTKL